MRPPSAQPTTTYSILGLFQGPEGACARVVVSWTVGGGVAFGGVVVGVLTVSGLVSPGFHLLAAPVLFLLGYTLSVKEADFWLVTLACIAIGVPEAYVLSRLGPRWRAVSMVVVLGPLLISVVVLIPILYLARKRLGGWPGHGPKSMTILDTLAIGPRERLMMVSVGGQTLLLGVTGQQIQLLKALEPQSTAGATVTTTTGTSADTFATRLDGALAGAGKN